MQTESVINLRKVRDVGDVLNDTFRFIRQNIRVLGKSLLFIAGPAIVLASISGAWMQVSILGNFDPLSANPFDISAFGLSFVMALVFGMAASVFSITVVYSTVVLYQDYGPGGFEVQDVWEMTKVHFWTILGTLFIVGFLMTLGLVIAIIPCLGALAYFIGVIYFSVSLTPLLPMLVREQIGITDGFSRSLELVKGYWWSTLGVLFVAIIIYSILGGLFRVPYYIFYFISIMHLADATTAPPLINVGLVVSSAVGSMGSILLYSIPLIATSLHYFNLVERKERTGLMTAIEAIDPGPPAEPPGFQPPADVLPDEDVDAPEEDNA